MNQPKVHFAGLSITLPQGWVDVTHDIPGLPPPTLAKEGGTGALQFSVGRYQSGAEPHIDMQALQNLMHEFAGSRRLGRVENMRELRGNLLSVSSDFVSDQEFIRVWYLTNSRDVALVTYIALVEKLEEVASELEDAETIVGSLEEL